MDRRSPTVTEDASPSYPAGPPPRRRRLSMDEDLLYHNIVTSVTRRPSQHRRYDSEDSEDYEPPPPPPVPACEPPPAVEEGSERLPRYSCSVQCEGVFAKKMEIEDTIKRAEDRRWHTVYIVLNGTALNIYNVKKDWGLGKGKGGPDISPDNPPWVRRGKLEKSYSLQYADVGIALDYQKRRHVIRVRAEDDQFLLSCVELSTFLRWLESLFAAVDVAAPIDERDFPRDQSIPRIQRIRWIRGQSPARVSSLLDDFPTEVLTEDTAAAEGSISRQITRASELAVEERGRLHEARAELDIRERDEDANVEPGEAPAGPTREPVGRLSTTSYPNVEIDYLTGKWAPVHNWSALHDMHYAKLCYSVLLFRSPRKSNYVISRGKKWYVDWATGRMFRVLPPEYGESGFNPWHVIHTENKLI